MNSTAVKLFLLEHGHQTFNGCDAVHKNQHWRGGDGSKCVQQGILRVVRTNKPYKAIAGGGDDRVHYNTRTQPSSCLIDSVDSNSDWISDAAVDEPLYRNGKRSRAELCRKHEMTLQWFVFLVLVTCLQSKHNKRGQ